VNVTGIVLAYDKGKCHKEASLLFREGFARPFDCGSPRIVEIAARPFDDGVVISLEDHSSLRRVAGDNLDDTACVGAVAHEIAEKDKALGTAAFSVKETRVQGLQVPVDVGQQGS
jgi:hypothetical protein